MTQLGTRGGITSTRPIFRQGGVNVYTALIFVAFMALLVAVVLVWYTSVTLFNTQNPFEVIALSLVRWPGGPGAV